MDKSQASATSPDDLLFVIDIQGNGFKDGAGGSFKRTKVRHPSLLAPEKSTKSTVWEPRFSNDLAKVIDSGSSTIVASEDAKVGNRYFGCDNWPGQTYSADDRSKKEERPTTMRHSGDLLKRAKER
jgi:hypothetical protein